MNFVSIVIGCCKGTAIFDSLRSMKLYRALFHLLLMCILSGIIAAAGQSFRVNPRIKAAAQAIGREFGSLTVSSRGVTVTRNPGERRDLRINSQLILSYLPSAGKEPKEIKLDVKDASGYPSAIYMGPELLTFAMRESSGGYLLSVPDGNWVRMIRPEASGLSGALAGIIRNASKRPDQGIELDPATLDTQLCYYADFGLFMTQAVQALFQALMFAGIFSLMFSLTGRARRTLKGKELVVVGIYAGFPAMLIGSLVPALDVPFLTYHFVYLFGMTGFLLFIINRIERDAAEKNPQRDEDGEDML